MVVHAIFEHVEVVFPRVLVQLSDVPHAMHVSSL